MSYQDRTIDTADTGALLGERPESALSAKLPLRTAETCAIICSNIQLFYFCKFEQMSRIENSGSEPFIRDRRII